MRKIATLALVASLATSLGFLPANAAQAEELFAAAPAASDAGSIATPFDLAPPAASSPVAASEGGTIWWTDPDTGEVCEAPDDCRSLKNYCRCVLTGMPELACRSCHCSE